MAQQTSRPILARLFDAAHGSGSSHPTDRVGGINVTRRLLLAAGCLCTACFMPASSFAAAPMVKTQAPAFYRLMLGDFEVTVLSDGSNMLPATKLLHGDLTQIEGALKRGFLGDLVETSHNSFLVNTGSKLVLIDAGAGRCSDRAQVNSSAIFAPRVTSPSRSMKSISRICTPITSAA